MKTSELPEVIRVLAHDVRWTLLSILARGDHRVQELVHVVGQPLNLVSYHLRHLREQQLVRARRSDADGRDVYYSLDLERLQALYYGAGQALHPLMGQGAVQADWRDRIEVIGAKPRVLFVCTHNSARSQMAEGLLRHFGGGQVEAFSAGSEPATVHPLAIQAMADLGIDIGSQQSKHFDELGSRQFDYVVTVCDRVREVCPSFSGEARQIHWSYPDPAEAGEDEAARRLAFQHTARQLKVRIHYLLALMDRELGSAS